MINLRSSLEEMIEASTNRALIDSDTPDGQQALARMTLLMSLLERLDTTAWDDCQLLPDAIPLTDSALPAVVAPPE